MDSENVVLDVETFDPEISEDIPLPLITPKAPTLWETVCDSTFSQARWLALYEAVNMIASKAEERGIPWEQVELKPIAIEKYVDGAADIWQRRLLAADHRIYVEYHDPEDLRQVA